MLLDMPERDTLEQNMTEDDVRTAERMWASLWAAYVRNKGSTSLIYWAEQMEGPKAMNILLIVLKDWIISDVVPERNWAQIQLNEGILLTHFLESDLIEHRQRLKFKRYVPEFKTSSKADLVRNKGKVSKSGLVREGFMKSGHTQYYFDTVKLTEYKDEVVQNVNKGMRKMRESHNVVVDDASYDQVAEGIVDHLSQNPELFTQGVSYIDTRGRAIKESLSKVANPIGYKDFRALLTIPE